MEVFKLLVQRHVDYAREEEQREINDDQALGELIAKYTKGNGIQILRIAGNALQVSGFNGEIDVLDRLVQEMSEEEDRTRR